MPSFESVSLILALAAAASATVCSALAIRSPRARLPANILAIVSLAALVASVTWRTVTTGHGPFTNMYEFAISFAIGILVFAVALTRRNFTRYVITISLAVTLGLIIFAYTLSSRPTFLPPALQNSPLLTGHVIVAAIAYGAFAISFAVALMYLTQLRGKRQGLPSLERLDDLGYRVVVIGFPFMVLTIVLGALWADIAWGTYWSWDPKETASLITALIYASYFHSRNLRGWRGKKSAILLIVGFVAVLLTFFGNYVFGGLHAY
jgi:cytochrome c-type biogenesis protein CcsB